ncbi:MAG: PQQ-dependent sugar dehydrogenase [Nitrospira sp.]|nr:PQQ-dependent sugar dehydrogenase [Nitrospira sp.]
MADPSLMPPQQPALTLLPVVTGGLQQPVYLAQAPGDADRFFVLEQPGRIRILLRGTLLDAPFLNIAAGIRFNGEQGLLGLAFHPSYPTNGRYFITYVRESDGAIVIAEYRASDDPNVSRRAEKTLLVVPQPYPNHKGGMLEFGPDVLLYIALGDGGAGGDPQNRGQNRGELLGKILRIDVDRGSPYTIPPGNPFARSGARPEIFAYGFRNPWRFSFDRHTGELWVADVGQDKWEEIDVVRAGGNYGWRIMEGRHCFIPRQGCPTTGLIPPVAEYRNDGSRCAVIGGYVYRGTKIPALQGIYLFGDYCSGEVFGLRNGLQSVLLSAGRQISSFGQDRDGELYVLGLKGTIDRIVEARP